MLAVGNGTIRVLLIDDHSVVRTGLRMLIENQNSFDVVGEAGTYNDALDLTRQEQPDVVLLDLDLAGDSGVDLLPQLLEATDNKAKVILLTAVQDEETHREAVRRGAMGLVRKEQAADMLVKAIEKVYSGEIWLERTMTASVFRELRGVDYRSKDPEQAKIESLTEREREVIELIGEGLKNQEIAERLFISSSTVRHHLTSIYDKLGVSDRLELVIYAFRHNLVQLPA